MAERRLSRLENAESGEPSSYVRILAEYVLNPDKQREWVPGCSALDEGEKGREIEKK